MQRTTHKKVKADDLINKELKQEKNNTQEQNSNVESEEQLRHFAKLIVSIYLFNHEKERE